MPSVLWCCWLGGRKGIRPVKNLSGGVMVWLFVCSEVQTCIWLSWCHCHSLSVASIISRLVLPFWYRLTRVVLDSGQLNGCVCVCYYLGPDWRHSTVRETPAQCHQSRPCVVDSPPAPCPQRRYAEAYDSRQSAALRLCNTHTPTHNQYLATTHCARAVLFRNFCGRSVTEGFLFAGAEEDVGFRFGVMTAHRKRHIYSCAN